MAFSMPRSSIYAAARKLRKLALCVAGMSGLLLLPARITTGQPLQPLPFGGLSDPVRARTAHTLKITDNAHLRLTKASGSLLHEAGPVVGTLGGSMRADMNIGASFTGEFTIYARGGTIRGHGTAVPHGSGRYESFGGSLVVTGGSGRFAHVHGRGGLFGTFDRRAFSFVIQTTGSLSY
jgi:hypothetical protein